MNRLIIGRRLSLGMALGGGVLLLVSLILIACSGKPGASNAQVAPIPAAISGRVLDSDGSAVAGAIVQIKGTPNKATTGADGGFTLSGQGLGGSKKVTLTAWSAGHFVGFTDLDPKQPSWQAGGSGIKIALKPLYTTDNNKYTWFEYEGIKGSASCAICHRESPEWNQDAHSQSAKNIRFISMYEGTNAQGQTGQDSKMGTDGKILPPDPSLPYYGPGYKLDNPSRTGNCASCHTPIASTIPNQVNCAWSGCHNDITIEHANGVIDKAVSPVALAGKEGITCEFCHKISEVILDPKTKLPLPDMPGILSVKLARPPDGQQVFFGTVIDMNRRVSYLPLEAKSEFCAPCHYGVFGGVVGSGEVTGGTLIYNSYGEWLNSPYSDPKTGKTCQECHMPADPSVNYTVFPEKGGITRDYTAFHSHTMPGAYDPTLLKYAVTMKSSATHSGDQLTVNVSINNDKTGHDVPTDEPMRSMMLVVQVLDTNGKSVTLSQGPALPVWTGNYSGQPGKAFAKILQDQYTGETPSAAYWRPVTIVEDTRIAPYATDSSQYTFSLPAGSSAKVKVTLIFRRAFQTLAQQKGWNDPDITMSENLIQVEK